MTQGSFIETLPQRTIFIATQHYTSPRPRKAKPMFNSTLLNTWISAAATGLGLYTGLNAWHEMPARQAGFVRDALISGKDEPEQLDFIEAFKAAAD